MPKIFHYLNYREFLNDFYQEKKTANPSFSFRAFADRAGFKSKSFVKLVIDGKKNLSEKSIPKINNALKLTDKALSYFSDLVAFNQAKSMQVRNLMFEKLCAYNRKNPVRLIQRQQYEFFSRWYHSTIRELVTLYPFDEDYAKLGKMVRPAIPERQARESVELLLKLGLVRKNGPLYEQNDSVITTGPEVQSLAVHNFHLQNIVNAGESLDTCPAQERDISCLIVGLSANGFAQFKKEIQEFRKRLLTIANADTGIERVYTVNFHLFPTSGKPETPGAP